MSCTSSPVCILLSSCCGWTVPVESVIAKSTHDGVMTHLAYPVTSAPESEGALDTALHSVAEDLGRQGRTELILRFLLKTAFPAESNKEALPAASPWVSVGPRVVSREVNIGFWRKDLSTISPGLSKAGAHSF